MQEIAELFGKSTTSISKVIHSFRMEGKVTPIKRQGLPKVTTERHDNKIQTISNTDPNFSVPKIRAKLEIGSLINVSTQTIRCRLYADIKHGRIIRKIPYLKEGNYNEKDEILSRTCFKANRFLGYDPGPMNL